MLRRLSIQAQITLFIALALLVLIAALETTNILQNRSALVKAERERSTVLAAHINTTIQTVAPLIATLDDISELEGRLENLASQNEGIDFIAVAWPDGHVLFHSRATYKGQTIDVLSGLPAEETTRVDVPHYGSQYLTNMTYVNPIEEGPGYYNVIIGANAGRIDDALLTGAISSLLITLGAAILIGLAMIYTLRQNLSIPLERVIEGANAFGKGLFDYRVKPSGSRELRTLAQTMNEMAEALTVSRTQIEDNARTMEHRVVERTRDLFLTIEVGQLASTIYHQDSLLRRVTNFISERFNLYYAQIYLLDDTHQYALLQFGTGNVGERLMSLGHRLNLSETSIVARTVLTGLPVLVSDTERSDIHLKNPLLPDTRSEVAIPLSIGGQVLGVLDLQSDQPNVFNIDNLPVFEAMANQLTASLRGAQAYEAAERSAERADAINRRLTYEAWESYLGRVGEGEEVVYHYDLKDVKPAAPDANIPSSNGHGTQMEAPIVLRGAPIGNIVVAQPTTHEWTDDERALMDSVAERIALTVEQYRAFDETQVALRQTALLYQASRRIGTAENLQDIVTTIANTLDISAVESGVLFGFEHDDKGKVRTALALANWSNNRNRSVIPVGTRFDDISELPGAELALSREPSFIQDTHHEPRLDPTTLGIFDQLDIGAALYLPLWIGNRQIGTLSFESSQPYNFSEQDLQIGRALAQQAAFAIDNRNLFQQMQKSLADTRLLYQAGRKISAARSEAEVIDALLENIPVEGIDRVLIPLCKEWADGQVAMAEVAGVWDRDGKEAVFLGNQYTPQVLPVLSVIGPKDVVLVKDFENPNHPVVDPQTQAAFRQLGVRSGAIIPIATGQDLMGWLIIETTKVTHDFTEQDIAPYMALADQAAIAMLSQRLFEEAQHRALELQSMAEISVQSSTILNVEQLLWTVSDLTKERFGYYHVQVYLLDKEQQYLILKAGAGTIGQQLVAAGHRINLNHQRSLVARAARTAESVVVGDVSLAADFLPNPVLPFTECEVALPLIASNQIVGVLDIHMSKANSITDADIRLQTIFAAQIATAVQNAQLFADATERGEILKQQQLALANLAQNTAFTEGDLDAALSGITRAASETLNVERTSVWLYGEDGSSLRCLNLYEASAERHSAGLELNEADYPNYFQALREITDVIAADDAHTHPVTREFSESYLTPLGINSMLDAPVRLGNQIMGVICHEHVGAIRRWTLEEQSFSNSMAGMVSLALEAAERKNAETETRRRALEVQTVAEVGIQASTILDVDQLLWTVSNLTKENFGLYHVHIYLIDHVNQRLVLAAGAGQVGREMVAGKHSISLNNERSLVARAVRSQQSVITNNVRVTPDFLPNPLLPLTQAEMAIPMIAGDSVIGVLDVQADKINYFTDEDARVQATLASQVAVTVQNARLFEQTTKRAAELRTVAEVSAEASASLDLQQLLKQVSNLTKERFGLYHTHIYLLNETGTRLNLAAGAGTVGDIMVGAGHHILYEHERSLVARVARSRQPIIANVVREEKEFLPNPLLPGTRAELAVPMIAGDQLIGVLDVQADQEQYFAPEDVQIQMTLASQIAIAVANARLFSQTQNSLAETALLYVASRSIAAARDPQGLVAALTESVNIQIINRAVLFTLEQGNANEITALKAVANWYQGKGTPATEIGRRYLLEQYPSLEFTLGVNPLFFDDTLHDDRIDPHLYEVLAEQNILSMIVLPLWLGDRQVGVLFLEAEQPYQYTDAEIRPFATLISEMAISLNSLLLLEQARQRAAELQTVAEVGTQATTLLDLDQLLQLTVDLTKDRFNLYHAHVYLLDSNAQYLELRAGAGEIGRKMVAAGHRIAIHNERSLVARAARTRQSVVANDVTTTSDFLPNPFLSKTRAEVALPLIAGDEVIGVLDVQSEEPGRFTPEDIQIKTTLASQVAVAVTNARSFAQEIAAEQALRQANLVVESSPAILFKWEADPAWPVLYVSENVKQFGYGPEEFLSGGITYGDLIHPDDRERVVHDMELFAESGAESIRLEYRIITKEGQIHWVEERTGISERDAEGRVTAFQGLIIDVTERERTARRQQTAYELGQQLATLLDPNQLLSETVNRLSESFGYYHAQIYLYDETRDSLLMSEGHGPAGAIMKAGRHSIPLRAERSLVASAARSLAPVMVNNVNVDPEHLPNPLLPETKSEVAVPLYHGQELIGVLDLQHNVTNYFNEDEIRTLSIIGNQLSTALANARLFGEIQLEAERRALLYEFGQRLAETLDPTAIANVVVENAASLLDMPEVILFRYDSAERTLETLAAYGELGQKMLGLTVSAAERPDILRVIEGQEMQVVRNIEELSGAEYALPQRIGLTAWILMPIAVADQVIGVLALNEVRGPRDFTTDEIMLAQNISFQISISLQNAYLYFEQVQITEQLREVDRLKSEFLASMSHELRTPLNSIIGYAEVLLDGIDGELTGEMEEDITAIHGSGKHLLNLINDILDLAKIEAGQMDLMTEQVTLKPFVEELLSTTSRVLIMGKPVEMITDIGDIPAVLADPLRLRQVVSNLVTNAIKFTEKGSITVHADYYAADPRMIQVSVIDTGIGITPENLQKVFERFRQVDQSATRRVGGTGLGLAITRQLIQMHGGQIWVESEYGVGSTFHFTLPIAG